jgi:hypothetical protein
LNLYCTTSAFFLPKLQNSERDSKMGHNSSRFSPPPVVLEPNSPTFDLVFVVGVSQTSAKIVKLQETTRKSCWTEMWWYMKTIANTNMMKWDWNIYEKDHFGDLSFTEHHLRWLGWSRYDSLREVHDFAPVREFDGCFLKLQ